MAKVTAKSVFNSISYFPFYIEWIRDPAFLDMKSAMGYEGSGIFLAALCYLVERPEYSARIDSIPTIARHLRISTAKLTKLVNEFDLFNVEDSLFNSPWLTVVMRRLDEQRAKSSAGGKKGMKSRWDLVDNHTKDALLPYEAPYNSKVKYSIEEESKEENSKVIKDNEVFLEERSLEEVGIEFNNILQTNSQLREFFDQPNCKRFTEYIQKTNLNTDRPFYASREVDIKKLMIKWLEKSKSYKNKYS